MITPNRLAEIIVKTITGRKFSHPKVININKKCLYTNGDLSFQLKLNYWRGYVNTESEAFKNSENILQYYEYLKNGPTNLQRDETHVDEILERFTNDVSMATKFCKIKNCSMSQKKILKLLIFQVNQQLNYTSNGKQHQVVMKISNNFVTVNYERSHATYLAVKAAIEKGSQYGIKNNQVQNISLTVECDCESDMTNERLKLLKKVSENLLKCHGCGVHKNESETNYIFTIKSEGHTKDNHVRYVCGAVLNSKKKKEKDLKMPVYQEKKLEMIKFLSAQRTSDIYVSKDNFDKDILRIANASINYEFLAIKHTSPVIIEENDDVDRFIKGIQFLVQYVI